MSIACLQYQYNELSKRYEMLLRAYDERCNSISSQDGAFLKLHKRLKELYVELTHVHKCLLIIGEKYLDLKYKRFTQKVWYEERIESLKCASKAVLLTAERARRDLDDQLSRCLACEHDTAVTLLLEKVISTLLTQCQWDFTSLSGGRARKS
ncbi:jg19630 [Pararge aegeria aegeria]|uniref:Jg19630 protein n=1 Tax=Pararge aegeria aegeria TaxID=348720 RepID=A0A8S4SBN5_9NEOP|nr:jg19630 [Pararge aegeria aegeria]